VTEVSFSGIHVCFPAILLVVHTRTVVPDVALELAVGQLTPAFGAAALATFGTISAGTAIEIMAATRADIILLFRVLILCLSFLH
jgi:hypothetical protein